MNDLNTHLIIIGGLGEIGKNMYCLTYNNKILIIDCGVAFSGETFLGIDYIVSDLEFLKEHEENIIGLLITHGHEDHIGSIPYLLNTLNIPVIYAPKHAKELINLKLIDRNIHYDNLREYDHNSLLHLDDFEVSFFRVNHSIPDSHGIAVKTPNGTFVTTGDFKFDFTPIGPEADLAKMAKLGEEGVTLLISDSTNALNPGISMSEAKIDDTFNDIFDKYPSRRIIIATFASNIYRLKHIIETCYQHNRKVATFGRSMENNIKISLEGNYIEHPEIFIKKNELNQYKPEDIVILSTGTQGEPLAALSRIASGTHKQVKLKSDDIVIFSSSAIPGNNLAINRTINKLYLQGVKVYTVSDLNVHTSGHANEEELKLMLKLLKPKYFMPFHGEYRMLKKHASIALSTGIPQENIFVLKNGESLTMNKGIVTKGEIFPTDDVYINSDTLKEVNGSIIRERKMMSSDGILLISINIDLEKKKLLIEPTIATRGFIVINENTDLINTIKKVATETMMRKLEKDNITFSELKSQLINDIYLYIYKEIGRKPLVVPIIANIKEVNVTQ